MDRDEKAVVEEKADGSAETPSNDTLARIVEALIFASDAPLPVQKIAALVEDASPSAVREALDRLAETYDRQEAAFELVEVAGGYQLCTRPRYAHWVERLFRGKQRSRLSGPALETLAIVAYRQPVTKAEAAEIRGVDVDGVLRTLLERNLVTVVGRKEAPGRPLLFGTSKEFLIHFGLNFLQDLPSIEEMEELIRERDLDARRADAPAAEPEPAEDGLFAGVPPEDAAEVTEVPGEPLRPRETEPSD
jgi:segregation and condensation protein B